MRFWEFIIYFALGWGAYMGGYWASWAIREHYQAKRWRRGR